MNTLVRKSVFCILQMSDVLVFFCPPGCLGTAGALLVGLRAFNQGKTRQSQLMMRGRIVAQGFTVVAIIVGVLSTTLNPKE